MCLDGQISSTKTIKFDLVATGASALVTIAGLDTRTAKTKTISATAVTIDAMAEITNASAMLIYRCILRIRKHRSAKLLGARLFPRVGVSVRHATGKGSKTAAESR